MEFDSVRSFRANIKQAFDYVLSGSEEGDCIIRRGDDSFKLVLENWRGEEERVHTTPKPVYTPPAPTDKKESVYTGNAGVCKNGHIARDGKCTWKGCKYS